MFGERRGKKVGAGGFASLSCHGEKEGTGSCKGGSRRCVCQVCLSHLRLSAPYANGQGGLGGTAPWETAGANPAC